MKPKPKVVANYKMSRDSKPIPISGRRGYGKHQEWMYLYDKHGHLFKFKENDNCIVIDRYMKVSRDTRKRTTVTLYIEPHNNDIKQVLEMILKGRGYGLYSINETSRKEIAARLTKEAVVRRMTK